MRQCQGRLGVGALALVVSWAGEALAQQIPPGADPSGAQVLTQGPIHEAFASPVLFDPKPGPVVPKAPPGPVPEVPPDQKPAGDNVQWIPGYWAWDDSRNDFLWVSGVWRAIPPGRQWVPGYWQQAGGGYQWVAGFWGGPGGGPSGGQTQYLPEPPASLENGPNSPPPGPEATWSPGLWVWQENQYLWRPGFWVQPQPGWMWSPASYSWSPNGYVYNQGFWDYPLANRGTPFAPVYYSRPIYNQPGYAYTPGVGLLASALLTSLFVRPAYSSYYFGDYYGANRFQQGIYPYYAFHGSRYGYDPIYSYAAAQNFRNPGWANSLHEVYDYRRNHPEARPPHTFAEMNAFAGRPNAGTFPGSGSLALARPYREFANPIAGARAVEGQRFERVEEARRQEIGRQSAQLHQFRDERVRREAEGFRAAPAAARAAPRQLEMPRSPIAAAATRPGGQFHPPAMPAHPEINRNMRPAAANAAPIRHEPHPEVRPPAPHGGAGPRRR